MLEDALLIQSEVMGGAKGGVGDDGDAPAGEGLDAGKPFDFGVRAMDVEVDRGQERAEVLLAEEADLGRIREMKLLEHLLVVAFLRSLAAEDQLDVLLVFASPDGADEEVLPFLLGEAADHGDDEFAFPLRLPLPFDGVPEIVDPVGDDVGHVLRIVMGVHLIGDHLGGAMDVADVVVMVDAIGVIKQIGEGAEPKEVDRRRDCVGLEVIGGRHRLAKHRAHEPRVARKLKREERMDDVGFGDGLEKLIVLDFDELEAFLMDDRVEDQEGIVAQNDVILMGKRPIVGGGAADDRHLVALFFQRAGKANAGGGRAVGREGGAF